MKLNVILFDGFVTLDAMGPVEVFRTMEKYYEIGYYSEKGGMVSGSGGLKVETRPLSDIEETGIILIPGGMGTRREVNNASFIQSIKELCEKAEYVLTVCTGSALLAKTGLLKGCRATTNKMAYDWVVEQDHDVLWVQKARWVVDGKYYTSSGVTAGMDMALGFIADRHSLQAAEGIARGLEYIWNREWENDPFAPA